MIPLGSLTAVQEIVNGSVTLAPSVGETADGAGGAAATARPPALIHRIIANTSVRRGRPDVRHFITHLPMIGRILRVTPVRIFRLKLTHSYRDGDQVINTCQWLECACLGSAPAVYMEENEDHFRIYPKTQPSSSVRFRAQVR